MYTNFQSRKHSACRGENISYACRGVSNLFVLTEHEVIMLTLDKARRVLKERGVSAMMDRGKSELLGAAEAYWGLKSKPTFESPDSLLDFAKTSFHGFLRPIQVRSEIRSLVGLVREIKPRSVLEIGTAKGGTLFLWTRLASDDAHLISIDLPGGGFGNGYVKWRSPIYRSFAIHDQRIDLVRGNSHSESILERTKNLLGDRSVDFLYIDAGHTYDDVKQDFEMYSGLVAQGGLIAFHDIAVHAPATGCEVHRFWSEIKPQHDSGEFIQESSQGWAGIGYLRWNGPDISQV
jgi:predicted O-methyltransferase YrrM